MFNSESLTFLLVVFVLTLDLIIMSSFIFVESKTAKRYWPKEYWPKKYHSFVKKNSVQLHLSGIAFFLAVLVCYNGDLEDNNYNWWFFCISLFIFLYQFGKLIYNNLLKKLRFFEYN